MSLSIFHRLTGVILSLGLLLVVVWLQALSGGAGSYEAVSRALGYWFVQVFLGGWAFAFFYHLCNGVRHLLWDAGHGFDLRTARRTAGIVVVASVVLTALSFVLASGLVGGGA